MRMALERNSKSGVRACLFGTSCLALAMLPGMAMAQDTSPADNDGGVAEIVVTAQKVEQNLQDVPVAVTAVSPEQIENRQLRTFNDLAGIAPNVSAVQSVSGSDPIVTMRGIVGGNATNGTDTPVAMYIDGIYLARTTGASFDVADLERVEVLRGPQGTLYGKNSTGGAINFITASPRSEFYARLEGTVGNMDRYRVKAHIDTGKIGPFSIAASYLHDQQNGWTRNLDSGIVWDFSAASRFFPGKRTSAKWLGSHNTDAGFLAVRLQPEGSSVTVDYKFDITDSKRTNQAQQVIIDNLGVIPKAQVSTKALDAVSMPFTTPEHLKTFGHSLTIQADLGGGFTLKSLAGYRGSTDRYSNDVAGAGGVIPNAGEFALTNILAYEDTKQFSQENQISYKSKLFSVIAGTYYFHETTTSTAPVYIFQFVPFTLPNRATLPPTVDGDVTSHNESYSAYAQVTLHATDRLDVTGGIRYTKDTRAATERGTFLGVPKVSSSGDFNHTDWAAIVNYRPTDEITVYAKASSGYLSGGVFSGYAFAPETVVQYEGGVKTELLDHHLRVNLAGYHTDYKNLQAAGFYPAPNNPNVVVYYIKNVASAKINGFEAEITAVPVKGLTLNASYGYTDFKYNVAPTGIVYPAYRPKHTLTMSANYKFPEFAGGIQPILDINANYTGNQYFLPGNGGVPYSLVPAAANLINRNASWVVDARFTLAEIPVGGTKVRASIWSKNIFDDRSATNATDATGGFVVNAQFREPRTFGLDLGIEF